MPAIPLTPQERAEIALACKDPASFHSDGREVFWACTVIPVLCVPILAVLANDALPQWNQLRQGELRFGPSLLFFAPELLGAIALSIAALALLAYGLRTRGRHGVVITSFGVARLRGPVRELIRYPDIVSITLAERRLPQHRIRTDELEIKARDGRVILLYGFGLAQRQHRIEAALRQ